ncbi:hypothetical protein DFH29DRAFT_1006263 [Suillus ampliporus]|nr:hypothetical protein DFH29DRAFT_1006263 [Suillus ampliporus]
MATGRYKMKTQLNSFPSGFFHEIKMDANQAKAEFLRSKIPAFRRRQPWDSQTDLLVDDILEEFDERWPLWEQVLPGLDVKRDIPIIISQAAQLRETLEKCRVVSTSDFSR